MNVDNFITVHGSSVTLKTVTLVEEDSVYGTQTESYANSSIVVLVQRPREDDVLVTQGILGSGDMIGYFKTTDTVKEGDFITWNSVDWELTSLSEWDFDDTQCYVRAGLKKVDV